MGSEMSISDEAVRAATGKAWSEWFDLLDAWGAAEKGHKETARHLAAEHGLSPWWSQGVTVRYEQERLGRKLGERAGGRFELSVTRTIEVPPERAFDSFARPEEQSVWFTTKAEADLRVGGRYRNADGDRGEFLRVERPESLRFTWDNPKHCPGTVVDVVFLPLENGRTRVALTHSRLASQADYEEMKEGWSWAMDSYRSYLQTGRPIGHEDWLAARAKDKGEERQQPKGPQEP